MRALFLRFLWDAPFPERISRGACPERADSRHLQWPGRIGHKDRSGRSLRYRCRASGSSARPRKWASATSASYQSLAPWRWCATAHERENTMGCWLDRMLARRPQLEVAIALETKWPDQSGRCLRRTGLSRPGRGSGPNGDESGWRITARAPSAAVGCRWLPPAYNSRTPRPTAQPASGIGFVRARELRLPPSIRRSEISSRASAAAISFSTRRV